MVDGDAESSIVTEMLPGGVVLVGKEPLSYAPNDFTSIIKDSLIIRSSIGNPNAPVKKLYKATDEQIQLALDSRIIQTSSLLNKCKKASEIVSHSAHLTADNPILDYLALLKMGEPIENPNKMAVHKGKNYLMNHIYDETDPLTIEQIREGLTNVFEEKDLMSYFRERHIAANKKSVDDFARISKERKELTPELIKLEFLAMDHAFKNIHETTIDNIAQHPELKTLYGAMDKEKSKESLIEFIQLAAKEDAKVIDSVYKAYSEKTRNAMKADRERSLNGIFTDYFTRARPLLVKIYSEANRETLFDSVNSVITSKINSISYNDSKWMDFSIGLMHKRMENQKKIKPNLNEIESNDDMDMS